jgi:PAS domain S-box-containing protein
VGRRVEIEAQRADGSIFPVELSISDVMMGGQHYFVANLRDITAQKRTAAELKQAQASLEAIFDNIPAALYLRDRQDNLVMINSWGARFLGRDPDEMIGQPMSKFREPQNADGVAESDAAIVRDHKPITRPFTYHLPDGDRVGLMTFFPVLDDLNQVVQIGGMMLDATELYRARNELQEARSLLQSIFDNVPAVLYLRELDGRMITVNKWGAAVLGADDPSQVIGVPAQSFDNEEQRETARINQENLLATGLPMTQEYRRMVGGREVVVLNSIFPVQDNDGNIVRIGGFATDVTELYRARNELQEAQNLLQTIFDNVPAELYLRELNGKYLMANKWSLDFYGLTEADLPNLTAETFDVGDETEVSRQAQRELMATGMPVTREYHQTARGRDVVILNTIFPMRNAEGEIDRIGGVSTDITELHLARNQLRQAQDNLHQSEKLAALGQLLAGVAHELNNPLAVVLGRAAILQEKLAGTPHEASLQKLREAAHRCARIVKTFLAMARQTGPRRQMTDVNDLVESALEMTTYGLRKTNIEWTVTRLRHPLQIEVDEDQIVQVLINLILNAQHALTGHGGRRKLDITALRSAQGDWVHLTVADTGPGVPDTIASRIFDPFFTTKSVGEGTGLGLSVCKSMVEAHGGKLIQFRTEGGGASFRVSLPVGTGKDTIAGSDIGEGGHVRVIGHILIVDDEIEIAAILADCLAPLGVECTIATDGHSALQRLTETAFDGIFCDVSMPGMDGITFYNQLKKTSPFLARHLIFISGDVLHREWDRLKASVDRPVIEKPFDPRQVREAALSLLTKDGEPR